MRTRFAKMVVLPSLALAMLMAVEPATHAQEYLSQEAAYFHRHHTQRHHWPMIPRPIRTTGSVPFVRWGRTMSSRAIALSAATPTRSFGESSCATTIRVGRTEFRERYRVPGLRPTKTFKRSRS
jgi:hypothetical protein